MNPLTTAASIAPSAVTTDASEARHPIDLMDWQQKLSAIQSFAGASNVSLYMRAPGDWYVHSGMSVGGDGMLRGEYGNGKTPEDAVEDHFRIYSELPFDRYAVNRDNLRAKWVGFMWQPISDEEARALRGEVA